MRAGFLGRRAWVPAAALLMLSAAFAVAPALASVEKPPQITITSPEEGAVLHRSSVKVEGKFKVAPFNGPSPKVTATLNGKAIETSVNGPVSYDFHGTASLHQGANALTVAVDDGNGGESSATVNVAYVPLEPTRRQCVADKNGDSHDRLTHMDIVKACARRRGGRVIFSVTTAKPPPKIHDSFGNPAAPCLEIARPGNPTAIETCGDAQLRGWKMNVWPKVPFHISGRVSTWKVPLKYLPRRSFKWRAYVADADHHRDDAPDKGLLKFVVRTS
jgi:hypothetical protein